jgi:hypothetical protein
VEQFQVNVIGSDVSAEQIEAAVCALRLGATHTVRREIEGPDDD